MDYYDHDEGERKQMQHSGGAARIYRSGQDESGSGGSGSEDSCSGSRIANEDDNGDDYDEDEALDLVNF